MGGWVGWWVGGFVVDNNARAPLVPRWNVKDDLDCVELRRERQKNDPWKMHRARFRVTGTEELSTRARQIERDFASIRFRRAHPHRGGTGFVFIFSRKCLPQVTQGCSGPPTGGFSRLSEETCCAISWPELSRPTPRIFAPFVQIRHRQTKPAAAPRRAAQLTPRPLPTLSAR